MLSVDETLSSATRLERYIGHPSALELDKVTFYILGVTRLSNTSSQIGLFNCCTLLQQYARLTKPFSGVNDQLLALIACMSERRCIADPSMNWSMN